MANSGDVIRHIVPGRVVRLQLTREQKRALADVDGQIVLDVLRHLPPAREAAHAPDGAFPLTDHFLQAVAARLGHQLGIKRARVVIRRLHETGVIRRCGQSRHEYGHSAGDGGLYFTRLYKFAAGFAPLRSKHRPPGKRPPVKRRPAARWWQVGLFADPDGRPPPGISRRKLAKMLSFDERHPRPSEASR